MRPRKPLLGSNFIRCESQEKSEKGRAVLQNDEPGSSSVLKELACQRCPSELLEGNNFEKKGSNSSKRALKILT